MKIYCLPLSTLTVFSLLISPVCDGASLSGKDREARIARIITLQLGSAMSVENIPPTASTLQFVRQTNPTLTQTQWNEIVKELNDVMISAMNQPGNPMFEAYNKVLGSFSEVELAKVEVFLSDPLYQKYSNALVSPGSVELFMKGLIENSPWMPGAMNLILRKHGLKEVH